MKEPSDPATAPSLEPPADAVKDAHSAATAGPQARGFARHFEGWELGGIAVTLVLAAALLAVPRKAVPNVLPVPLRDVVELEAARAKWSRLANRAEREGLPFETRAVGDTLRRLGLALARRPQDVSHLSSVMRERVQIALALRQQAQLAGLLAVQARLFVRAARLQTAGTEASEELLALGGDFVTRATQNGWLLPDGPLADDDELHALFVLRWLALTHLRDVPELRPSLSELRLYYRFLLLHPERGPGVDPPARERAQLRLRYVATLARYDHDYPAALARGCLLAQLDMRRPAVEELRRHLARGEQGVWGLRARNYLLYAAEGLPPEL